MTETLLADLQARTLKGLLLPWGEASRNSNIGVIEFERGTVTVPQDPAVVTLNRGHKREDPVGRAIELQDTDAGIEAAFAVAETPEGDELLLDVSEGRMTKLSAEVKDIIREGTKGIKGALFGAAVVTEGAFASAALYAELADDVAEELSEAAPSAQTIAEALSTEQITALKELLEKLSEAPAEEVTPQEKEEIMEAQLHEETSTAKVPTLLAGASQATATSTAKGESKYAVANALAAYFSTRDSAALEALSTETRNSGDMLFAALNDIKSTYAGSVGAAIMQPQWLGDVWSTRTYERKYTPLVSSAPLTSLEVKGYRYTTPATGDTWSGDKTDVPSSTPVTEAVTGTALRWAGGHDIAREFLDFQGQFPAFWDGHFTQMSNSYAKKTDVYVVDTLEAGATAITAGTVPSGANAATVSLVDGALAVIANDAVPSFAICAPDQYRSLLLQGKDDLIATLSLSMGLESGDLAGFKIVPSSAVATGKVIVGSKDAATFYELPGSPLRTEAQDIAKGGIDQGFFGYYLLVINSAGALAKVTPA